MLFPKMPAFPAGRGEGLSECREGRVDWGDGPLAAIRPDAVAVRILARPQRCARRLAERIVAISIFHQDSISSQRGDGRCMEGPTVKIQGQGGKLVHYKDKDVHQ